MKSNKSKAHHVVREVEGGAAGAAAGAVLGAVAGPPGMVAGAVIGGVVGAVAAGVLDTEADREALHQRELDKAIGMSEGELGAPNLEHPPAKDGAYSAASVGASSHSDSAPAEGTMSTPED